MCAGLTVPAHWFLPLCKTHTHTHTWPCEEKANMINKRVCATQLFYATAATNSEHVQVGFNLLHPAALMHCFLSFHGSVTHRTVVSTIFSIFNAEAFQAAACAKNLPRLAALRAGLRTRMLRRPRNQSLPTTAEHTISNAQKYMFTTCVNCPNCWTVMNPLKEISYTRY